MSAQPIDPADIRVGDEVFYLLRIRVKVAEIGGGVVTAVGGSSYSMRQHPSWMDRKPISWELIERPQPKPEVGQHWLDEDGREWVVLRRGDTYMFHRVDSPDKFFNPICAGRAPAGWTVQS